MACGDMFRTFQQFLAALIASGVGFATGIAFGWTNSPITFTRYDDEQNDVVIKNNKVQINDRIWLANTGFSLSPFEFMIMVSALNVGGVLASIPSGFFVDAVGRKSTLLLLFGPYILGWLFILASTDVVLLSIGRFVIGAAAAASTVVGPVYLYETAPAKWRGVISGLFKLQITLGILFAYVMGTFMTTLNLILLCLLVHFVIFIPMFWIPETPLFLLWSNQRKQAERSLRWLRGDDYEEIDTELEEIQQNLMRMRAFDLQPAGFWHSLKQLGALRLLFICLALACLAQLTAVNVIIMSSTAIFSSSTGGLDPRFSTICVGCFYVVATAVSIGVADKYGRRLLLLISTGSIVLCLGMLGAYFYCEDHKYIMPHQLNWAPLTCLSIIVITFALGIGTVPWMMMNELLPPNLSGQATALSRTVFWLSGALVTVLSIVSKRRIGVAWTFWLLSVVQFGGFLFIYFLVPETKGKNAFEILEMLKKKSIEPEDSEIYYDAIEIGPGDRNFV